MCRGTPFAVACVEGSDSIGTSSDSRTKGAEDDPASETMPSRHKDPTTLSEAFDTSAVATLAYMPTPGVLPADRDLCRLGSLYMPTRQPLQTYLSWYMVALQRSPVTMVALSLRVCTLTQGVGHWRWL